MRFARQGAFVSFHNCGNGIYFDMTEKWGNPMAISHAYVADDVDSWEEHKAKWGKQDRHHRLDPAGTGGDARHARGDRGGMQGRDGDLRARAEDSSFPRDASIGPNAPLRNAKRIVEASKKYGVYK